LQASDGNHNTLCTGIINARITGQNGKIHSIEEGHKTLHILIELMVAQGL